MVAIFSRGGMSQTLKLLVQGCNINVGLQRTKFRVVQMNPAEENNTNFELTG